MDQVINKYKLKKECSDWKRDLSKDICILKQICTSHFQVSHFVFENVDIDYQRKTRTQKQLCFLGHDQFIHLKKKTMHSVITRRHTFQTQYLSPIGYGQT